MYVLKRLYTAKSEGNKNTIRFTFLQSSIPAPFYAKYNRQTGPGCSTDCAILAVNEANAALFFFWKITSILYNRLHSLFQKRVPIFGLDLI